MPGQWENHTAGNPYVPVGALMEVCGEYEQGSSAGEALVLITRFIDDRDFLGKVLYVRQGFWQWHLQHIGSPVQFRFASGTASDQHTEKNGQVLELATDWRCLADDAHPLTADSLQSVEWLPKKAVTGVLKEAHFLQEMVVSGKRPEQVGAAAPDDFHPHPE